MRACGRARWRFCSKLKRFSQRREVRKEKLRKPERQKELSLVFFASWREIAFLLMCRHHYVRSFHFQVGEHAAGALLVQYFDEVHQVPFGVGKRRGNARCVEIGRAWCRE